MSKFYDNLQLHKCSRELDKILTDLYCKELLDNKVSLDQKENTVQNLKQTRERMNRIEDANAMNHYKEGKANGILDGILIGELLMIGSYGLGKLIRYYLDKRA